MDNSKSIKLNFNKLLLKVISIVVTGAFLVNIAFVDLAQAKANSFLRTTAAGEDSNVQRGLTGALNSTSRKLMSEIVEEIELPYRALGIQEKEMIIKEIREWLEEIDIEGMLNEYGAKEYIFGLIGSMANNEVAIVNDSDVDIKLLVKVPAGKKMHIYEYLANKLGADFHYFDSSDDKPVSGWYIQFYRGENMSKEAKNLEDRLSKFNIELGEIWITEIESGRKIYSEQQTALNIFDLEEDMLPIVSSGRTIKEIRQSFIEYFLEFGEAGKLNKWKKHFKKLRADSIKRHIEKLKRYEPYNQRILVEQLIKEVRAFDVLKDMIQKADLSSHATSEIKANIKTRTYIKELKELWGENEFNNKSPEEIVLWVLHKHYYKNYTEKEIAEMMGDKEAKFAEIENEIKDAIRRQEIKWAKSYYYQIRGFNILEKELVRKVEGNILGFMSARDSAINWYKLAGFRNPEKEFYHRTKSLFVSRFNKLEEGEKEEYTAFKTSMIALKQKAKDEYTTQAKALEEALKAAALKHRFSTPQSLILYAETLLENFAVGDLKEALGILLKNNVLREVILYAENPVYNEILGELIEKVKEDIKADLIITKKTKEELGLKQGDSEVKEIEALIGEKKNVLCVIKGTVEAQNRVQLRDFSRDRSIPIIVFNEADGKHIYSLAQALESAIIAKGMFIDLPPVEIKGIKKEYEEYKESLRELSGA